MLYLKLLVAIIAIPIHIGACSIAEGDVAPRVRTPLVKASDSLGGFCGFQTGGACSSNTDCIVGGASSQICQSSSEEMIITTAEWIDCYDAKAHNVSCACVENSCQWIKSNSN